MVWHGWQRIEISKNSPLGICVHWARWILGLRASQRLLLGVCSLQLIVLVGSFLQLLSRSECAISLPKCVASRHPRYIEMAFHASPSPRVRSGGPVVI